MVKRYGSAALLVSGLLLAVWLAPIGRAQEIHPTIKLDGSLLKTDAPAILDQAAGRTLVPVRALAEPLGYTVTWDAKTKTVRAERAGRQLQFQIGSKQAVVNGAPATLSVAPRLENGRTLVPLRFFAEISGAQVSWDEKNNTIEISSPTSRATGAETHWTHQQGNQRRTGFNPLANVGAAAQPVWVSDVKLAPATSAVMSDEFAFVSGVDNKVYALDRQSGAVVWSAELPYSYTAGTPTYDPARGQVYVSTDEFGGGKLYAFDATSGKALWFAATGGQWAANTSPTVTGNLVIIAANSKGSTLLAFDAATGSKVWEKSAAGGVVPAVSGNRVFLGYTDGEVATFRALDGEAVWNRQSNRTGAGGQMAMVDDGRVYFADETQVIALDEQSGDMVWQHTDLQAARSGGLASDGARVWLAEPGGLVIMDGATGDILRRPALCNSSPTAPAISTAQAFVACDGRIYAVDRATYAVKEMAAGAGPIALDGDQLFFMQDGHLAALRSGGSGNK